MTERADNLPLEEKELKGLIRDLDRHKGLKAMLFLVLGTGMSLDDALGIKLQDIDYKENLIRLYDRGLARTRFVRLNVSVLGAITDYQDGRYRADERLFDITGQTAITRLYELSQSRIGRPITWMAIRRTWAVLGFKEGLGLKDMIESSGTTAQQLAVWSLWERGNGGKKEPPDLLAGLLK